MSIGNLHLKIFRNVLVQTREIMLSRNIMKPPRQESIRDGISAIGHHTISKAKSVLVQPFVPWLIAEWQQRGPETLSGGAVAKLRLTFAPAEAATTRRNISDGRGT